MPPNVPPPPDTPPRGGAAYTMVDVGMLAERAADRALQAVELARSHDRMISRIPAIETKLDLALAPVVVTRSVRVAAYVGAASLLVLALLAVYHATTPPPPRIPSARLARE